MRDKDYLLSLLDYNVWANEEYFKQLTAEEVRTRMHHGFAVRYYKKIRERNEALDLRVLERRDLNKIKLDGQLFVITAGMMSEHTAAHELAVRMAPTERHAIHFVGYAAPDTPAGGRRRPVKGGPGSGRPDARAPDRPEPEETRDSGKWATRRPG